MKGSPFKLYRKEYKKSLHDDLHTVCACLYMKSVLLCRGYKDCHEYEFHFTVAKTWGVRYHCDDLCLSQQSLSS